MSIFLSDIDESIRKSLIHRQTLSNTRTQTGWFMDKQCWVRLTSMAGIVADDGSIDSNLRKKWILFGGVYGYNPGNNSLSQKYASGFHEMYNMNSYYYNNDQLITFNPNNMINNPIPGIVSVDIQNKGTMGSVREASIKFVCWDINQLNVLENLYMTPGVSLLLEWGWNKDVYGKNITSNLSTMPPMHDYCLVKKATKEIQNAGGHYGAIQGRVVNFGWSYKINGGFDCHVTITSMAEAFLSADIHSKSQNLPSIGTKKNDDETSSDKRVEENIMYQILHTLEELDKYPILRNPLNNKISAIKMKSLVGKKKDDESDWWSESQVSDTDGGQYFVTFETLLETINSTLSFIQVNNSNTPAENPDCSAELLKNSKGEIIGPTFDTSNIEINYKPQLLSADPWVCMLTTPIFYSTKGFEIVDPILGNSYLSQQSYDYFSMYPELKNFSRKAINPNKIDLNTFLINLKYIYECYKTTKTVNDFILKILTGVSESCGSMWKFELMIDHDRDPSKISIVEIQTTLDTPMPFTFKLGTIDSIVINANIETEVDNDIKLQALYGSTSSKNQTNNSTQENIGTKNDFIGYNLFGKNIINLAEGKIRPIKLSDKITQQIKTKLSDKVPIGFIDRYKSALDSGVAYDGKITLDQRKLTMDDRAFISKLTTDEQNDLLSLAYELTAPTGINNAQGVTGRASLHSDSLPTELEINEGMIYNDYITAIFDVYKQRTPTSARLAIAATSKFVNDVIWAVSNKETKLQPQYTFPLIPLKLSITIDGICGLKNGNCIDVTYKPLRYIDRTYFQITNVTHSLNGASWTTTIETLMRVDMSKLINTNIEARQDISTLTAPVSSKSKLFISVTPIPGIIGEFGTTWSAKNDRAIAGLHPSVRKDVINIINELDNTYKLKVEINEGLRTSNYQKKLYGRWKSTEQLKKAGFDDLEANQYADPNHKGTKATTALPGNSPHEFGFAVDMHPSYSTAKTTENYNLIATVAKKYGFLLEQTPNPDKWHFQKIPAIGMANVRKRMKTGQIDSNKYVILT